MNLKKKTVAVYEVWQTPNYTLKVYILKFTP